MKVALAVMLLCLALGSCAGMPPERQPEAGLDYRIDVRNSDVEKRFDLALVSTAAAPLCLTAEQWPNDYGWLDHQGGPWVWAEADGMRFPFLQNNGGYCPGCIVAKIPAGQTAQAFLPYSRFVGLDDAIGKKATLHIIPSPSWCRQ